MRITGLDKTIKDLTDVKEVIEKDILNKKNRLQEIDDQIEQLEDEAEKLEEAIEDKENTLTELASVLAGLKILSVGNKTQETKVETSKIEEVKEAQGVYTTIADLTSLAETLVSKVEEE